MVPYATSGNAWPSPQLITLSFEPDGTNLGGRTSNLFATFNAALGSASAWQGAILKAAGVSDDTATLVATSLVASNLRGVDSHGVQLLPYYVEQLEAGVKWQPPP